MMDSAEDEETVEYTHELVPIDIKPRKLTFDEYDIKCSDDGKTITEVINKTMGQVEFTAIQVDIDQGSSVGMSLSIYTNLVKKVHADVEVELLNVLHIHFNNTNDDISIDSVYMDEGQTKNDHMEFANDVHGFPLRYKVLINNMAVNTILYNNGQCIEEIPFEEIRMEIGDKVTVNKHSLSQVPLFGEIVGFPNAMISSKPADRAVACTV